MPFASCDIEIVNDGCDEHNAVLAYLRAHYKPEDHKNFDHSKSQLVDHLVGTATAPPAGDWFQRNVHAVYRLRRDAEHADYHGNAIGNEHHLVHASRIRNWVGILSRGLLLPAAVTALGIRRTDFGWLGAGIYFGSEVSLWILFVLESEV